jgi:hypothetical protein
MESTVQLTLDRPGGHGRYELRLGAEIVIVAERFSEWPSADPGERARGNLQTR